MKELMDKEEKEYVRTKSKRRKSMSTIWDSIITKTSNARIDSDVTDEDLGIDDDDHGSTLKRDVGDVEASLASSMKKNAKSD